MRRCRLRPLHHARFARSKYRRHREADRQWFLAGQANGINGSASDAFRYMCENHGGLMERQGKKGGKKGKNRLVVGQPYRAATTREGGVSPAPLVHLAAVIP